MVQKVFFRLLKNQLQTKKNFQTIVNYLRVSPASYETFMVIS